MPLSNPANIVIPSATTAATALVPASVSSSQILMAANPKRANLTIFNDSTANLYIDFTKAATLTDFAVKIMAGGYYELPINFTGSINGLWDGTNGNARIRDLSYS